MARIPPVNERFSGEPIVTNPLFALAVARGMVLLNASDDEGFTNYCADVFGSKPSLFVANEHPRYAAVRAFNSTILLIGGIDGIADAVKLFLSYSLPVPKNVIPFVPLPTYFKVAEACARLQDAGFLPGEPLILCGHSWGGAIAVGMALQISLGLGLQDQKVQVISFCSPRSIRSQFLPYLQNTIIVRYMVPNDWVPFLPPYPEDVSDIPDTLSLPLTIYRQWHHPGEGRYLTSNGPYRVQETPDRADRPTGKVILELLSSQNGFPLHWHTMRYVVQQLELQIGIVPPDVPAVDQPSPLPSPPALFNPLAVNPLSIGAIDVSFNVRKPLLPTVVKSGGEYGVMWMGRIVAIAHSRSVAKLLGHYLVKGLQRLYPCETVDVPAFQASFVDCLAVLEAGGQGSPGPLP